MILPAWVFAQNDSQTGTYSGGMGFALLKTIIVLCVILALILVTVYLLKRFLPNLMLRAPSVGKENNRIQVIDVKAIEPRKSLLLVKIGNKEILVGLSDAGFSNLGQWEAGKSEDSSMSFDDHLSS